MKRWFFSSSTLVLCFVLCSTYYYGFAQPVCPRKIFFTSPSVNNPATNIWMMDSTGTNRVSLFNDNYYRQVLTVAHDGTKLAYSKRKNPVAGTTGGDSLWICTSNIDGSNELQHYLLPSYLNTEIRDLDFDTSDEKILFNTFEGINRDGNLYVLDIINLSVTQLTFNTTYYKGEAQYSPDNSTIVYTECGTNWFAYPVPGKMMSSNGTNVTTFTPAGYGNYHHFNYSPDGSKLVFSYFANLGNPFTLYTVNPNGTGLQTLNYSANWEMQPVFNPYSNRIALVDNNNMKLLDLSGTVLQTIFPSANTTFNFINWVAIDDPTYLIHARTDSTSVCANSVIQLYADTILSATYSWSGPNGYTSNLQNPVINNATVNHSGSYVVTVAIPGCGSYTDTVSIIVNSCSCAPVLQVADTFTYCPQTPCKLIAANLVLQDTCNTMFNGAKVYFNTNYHSAEDTLKITAPLPSGIISSFNDATGVLTLSGQGTAMQYQSILQSICYQNTNANPTTGQREIYFVIGDALYNPINNHYYKLINSASVLWSSAKNAAAATSYFGMQGYLATITSQQENNFFLQLLQSNAWIGGSDSAQEGIWRWVTGCEGLEDNGQGRHFSNQNKTGLCSANTANGVNGNYANWFVSNGTGEPNDCGCPTANHCEDYAHFRFDPTNQNGTWNDLNNMGDGNVHAYAVEYGCMPGDPPNIQTEGSVIVNVVANPTIIVSATQDTICAGNSTILSAAGAVAYTWTPSTSLNPATGTTVTSSPSISTTYNVVGIDANNCAGTSVKTITVLPIAMTNATQTICQGQSYEGHTFSGNYTDTFSTVLGCDSIRLLNLTVLPLPPTPIVTSPLAYCINALPAALIANGSNLLWYSSATGGTGSVIVPTPSTAAAGIHKWYVSQTINGCEGARDSITVTVNAPPSISVTPPTDTVCIGLSTTLTASGANTYTWSPGVGLSTTTGTITIAAPVNTTTYTIIGTDNNSCKDTTTATINVNPQPTLIINPSNTTICSGDSILLTASGGNIYFWNPATSLSDTIGAIVIAYPNTTITYSLLGTDANGCSDTITKIVIVNTVPIVTAASNSPLCSGQILNLTANSSLSGSIFSWMGPSFTSSLQNPSVNNITVLQSGNYVVTATLNNCISAPDTVYVAVHALPLVDAGQDTAICNFQQAQLQASGALNYTWSPSASLSCNNCSNPVASPTSTTNFTVTGTDVNNCVNTDTVTLTIYPLPAIDGGSDKTICIGESTQLAATGAQTYIWQPGIFLSCTNCNNPLATPNMNITYSVTGTDVNGCSDSDKINIAVIQKQTVSFGNDDSICSGQGTRLFANGGDSYQWFPSAGLENAMISNPLASPSSTTTYQVIIKQGNCFTDTGNVHVTVYPQPVVFAGEDVSLTQGSSATLSATVTYAIKFLWSPGNGLSCVDCLNPVAAPLLTTAYVITVSNELCQASDTVTVFVGCDGSGIFMPNTFTPNGDGLNDRLYPQRKGNGTVSGFKIFNRWGEMLYEAKNFSPNNTQYGWDGTYMGKPMIADVYVYIIDSFCDTGEPLHLKGDVILIR